MKPRALLVPLACIASAWSCVDRAGPSEAAPSAAALAPGGSEAGGCDAGDDGSSRSPPRVGDAASDATLDAGEASTVFDCAVNVEIGQLVPATCAVVDPVSRRVGRLEWTCGGGPARLTLGDLVLVGAVQGDAVSLSACRDDPMSWLSGHYETVSVAADMAVGRGALTYTRASGVSCARTFADCGATASVTILQ